MVGRKVALLAVRFVVVVVVSPVVRTVAVVEDARTVHIRIVVVVAVAVVPLVVVLPFAHTVVILLVILLLLRIMLLLCILLLLLLIILGRLRDLRRLLLLLPVKSGRDRLGRRRNDRRWNS